MARAFPARRLYRIPMALALEEERLADHLVVAFVFSPLLFEALAVEYHSIQWHRWGTFALEHSLFLAPLERRDKSSSCRVERQSLLGRQTSAEQSRDATVMPDDCVMSCRVYLCQTILATPVGPLESCHEQRTPTLENAAILASARDIPSIPDSSALHWR